jgi:hypothetical protein
MRDDYTLQTITFKPTNYRDQSVFKHPSEHSGLKYKRWELCAIGRDNDYVDGVSHPEDEFIGNDENTSFTEWRKKDEDFNPNEFLLSLVANFEELAEADKHYTKSFRCFTAFINHYGNDMNDNITDDDTVDTIQRFGKMYKLPTLNILPFSKARIRYWDQTYMFYSTCKLLTALFDFNHWGNVLGSVDTFKKNNHKIVIDEAS